MTSTSHLPHNAPKMPCKTNAIIHLTPTSQCCQNVIYDKWHPPHIYHTLLPKCHVWQMTSTRMPAPGDSRHETQCLCAPLALVYCSLVNKMKRCHSNRCCVTWSQMCIIRVVRSARFINSYLLFHCYIVQQSYRHIRHILKQPASSSIVIW